MKKTIVILAACALSLGVNAQDSKSSTEPKKETKSEMKKDHVMMKDGKMWTVMNGKSAAMDKEMTMKNGNVVMTDGTVKMKDGKTVMMKDGESMDMEGKMSHHEMKSSTK